MVISRKFKNGAFIPVSSIFADIQVTSKGTSSFAAVLVRSKISSCLAVVKASPFILRSVNSTRANCSQMAMSMYGKEKPPIL